MVINVQIRPPLESYLTNPYIQSLLLGNESKSYRSNGCPVERPLRCTKYNNCVGNKEGNIQCNSSEGTIICTDGECLEDLVHTYLL